MRKIPLQLLWPVLILVSTLTTLCSAQQNQPAPKTQAPSRDIQILYTGRLLGYFRAPNWQPGDPNASCDSSLRSDVSGWSNLAKEFHSQRESAADSVLVGTGDNFAPEIESRQFEFDPNDKTNKTGPRGKDVYQWYPASLGGNKQPHWVKYDQADTTLAKFLEQGWGFVPMDNVGCFLRAENYTAVVPGRHDFYFGPDRVRQLARFLASNNGPNGDPVQMLGANMVIETTWSDDHKPQPDNEFTLAFSPQWPKDIISPMNLKDGAKLYPWLPEFRFKIGKSLATQGKLWNALDHLDPAARPKTMADLSAYLRLLSSTAAWTTKDVEVEEMTRAVTYVNARSVKLCTDSGQGDPNLVWQPAKNGNCRDLTANLTLDIHDGSIEYAFAYTSQEMASFETLVPGTNYGLCITDCMNDAPHTSCSRFSVLYPFFTYHTKIPPGWPSDQRPPFQDPEPYVLKKVGPDPNDPQQEVAVFGVVDPGITEYVGSLNATWENTDKAYDTHTVIADPAEALKQLLAFFEKKYKADNNRDFEGMKVLLAEMSPQKAQALAAYMKKFNVVVSAADRDSATGSNSSAITWTPESGAKVKFPTFLATPPFFNDASESHVAIGAVILGRPVPNCIDGKCVSMSDDSWRMQSKNLGVHSVPMVGPNYSSQFMDAVRNSLQECVPDAPVPNVPSETARTEERLKWLTLCTMRRNLGADVALLQKRDLFFGTRDISVDHGEDGQRFLDRILWKGDLLTLIYVPGSALLQAVKQSKKYQQEAESSLSLTDERDRDLISIGMTTDKRSGDFLIDDIPLDPKRIYAVATSDYLGAGDTGYPDLTAMAVDPPQHPRQFPKELDTISGVVCHALLLADPTFGRCDEPLIRDEYLDQIALKPIDQRPGNTPGEQFWAWSWFDRNHKIPEPLDTHKSGALPDLEAAAQRAVEDRGVGSSRVNPPNSSLLSVDRASFSITSVDHKFSDAELGTKFKNSPVTQLTTPRGHSITFDIRPKYVYSWHFGEAFGAVELRYNTQYTGSLKGGGRTVSQKDNLFTSDSGFSFYLPHRQIPRGEIVGTFHYETQLFDPLAGFLQSLATSLKTSVAGAGTSRTHLLLPRIGFRWADRKSSFEVGYENGKELNAVRLITDTTGAQTLARPNIAVSGMYWNWRLVVPFRPNLAWTVDEDGDFFSNRKTDDPTDTRFRSDTKTQLNFQLWPSISFAPTYEFFYFENKVERMWFWQGQTSIQMKFRFDVWNHRQAVKQLKYNIPAGN